MRNSISTSLRLFYVTLTVTFGAVTTSLAVDDSVPVAATIPGDSLALPTTPLGVAMTANSADSITLSWYSSAKNDARAYNVYASSTKDGPYKLVTTVTQRTATISKLLVDTPYFFRVSATNELGEGQQSATVDGFTIKTAPASSLPVRVAKNMCLSLGANVVSDSVPISGKLSFLVDGSDATTCRVRKTSEIKIKINSEIPFSDADYLMLNFRAHGTAADWSNNPFARTLDKYQIIESLDSSDGKDGTWTEIASGTNDLLDGVIVLPNHKPKWIGIRNSGGPEIPSTDKRPMPSDLMLSRLDIFRSAPKGFRNDYWIFTGDSLIVQDMPAGGVEGRSSWFSDVVRKQHPDRYPIVVHVGRGGTIMANIIERMKSFLPIVAGPNGTETPTGTFLCFEPGFNDVGLGATVQAGARFIKNLSEAQAVCQQYGLFMVPVRIEYATAYLNPETQEPVKYNVFHNTLIVNLAGVDVFARSNTPYAIDPKTQLPYADYWTYTRNNYATAIVKDGVHHTKTGQDGINELWAAVADKMVYSKQTQ